jgi:hypothetical protein
MQLIKDMEAEIVVTMKEPKGNVMTLSFPYNCAERSMLEALNNVIYLKT